MARILSVRERVEREITARLAKIRAEEGYNTTLAVRRRRGFPVSADEAYQIWQQFGETRIEHRSPEQLWESVPMALVYSVPSDLEAYETEINFVRADIQKALQSDGFTSIEIKSNDPVLKTRTVDLILESDEPLYTEEIVGPLVMGMLGYTVRYSRLIRNPALWDDADAVMTE